MRWVLAVVACAACDRVLGLHGVMPSDASIDASLPFAYCDPLPYDALRYIPLGSGSGFTVAAAKTNCALRGYELVSFDDNDTVEQANQLAGAPLPFWTGLGFATGAWGNPDGCAPYLPWRPGEPSIQDATACGLMTGDAMVATTCATSSDGGAINVLCEAPRPSTACRVQQAQRRYRIAGMAQNITTAITMCNLPGEHVVEIDSGAELGMVDQLGTGRYWVGAAFVAGTWTTPTGCPAIYAWMAGQPNFGTCSGGCSCIIADSGGMVLHNCNDGAAVICETND